MQHVQALQDQFAIPGVVAFENHPDGLVRAVITSSLAEATVYLHGAHVTSYVPAGQPPVLWMSDQAVFKDGVAIRGGVPICFPWFGAASFEPYRADADAPSHGYARTQAWTVDEVAEVGETVVLTLSRTIGSFAAVYRIAVGASLDLSLTVTNTQQAAAPFEVALHSYFAVSDAREIRIEGLGGLTYLDQMDGMARKVQSPEPIALTEETDRIYLDTHLPCVIRDPALKRSIHVVGEGARSTVLWNPWTAKSQRMGDFPDEGWPGMVCVETGNIADNRVTLAPGQSHETRAILSSRSL